MEFHGTKWYFIWQYQSSMEFHGIFHGIPWNTCVIWNGALLIPWNPVELVHFIFGDSRVPWNIPCKSRVTWYWIKWQSHSSMEFHGTKWYFIWRPQSSMEFHGIFHGIPWNTCVIWNGALLIPWNHLQLGYFFYLATTEFRGIPWNIPCKSRVTWYWIKWQSQSSMEFHRNKWYFIWRHQSSMEYSMEFHGTRLYFIWRFQSSTEFHGIFHGITWKICFIWNGALLIPSNPMELGDLLFGDSRVPWNSMEYPMVVQGNMVLNKMTISKFHGNPWN